MSVQTVRCECGFFPLAERFFSESAWESRVGCKACGLVCGKGDDMPAAVAQWNRVQGALPLAPQEPLLCLMVIITGDSFEVRCATKEQLDRPISRYMRCKTYRADHVRITQEIVCAAHRKHHESVGSFIGYMHRRGITLEACK
jgi:hypothetical protein